MCQKTTVQRLDGHISARDHVPDPDDHVKHAGRACIGPQAWASTASLAMLSKENGTQPGQPFGPDYAAVGCGTQTVVYWAVPGPTSSHPAPPDGQTNTTHERGPGSRRNVPERLGFPSTPVARRAPIRHLMRLSVGGLSRACSTDAELSSDVMTCENTKTSQVSRVVFEGCHTV